MPADSKTTILTHLARFALAVSISIAALVMLMALNRTVLRNQPLTWFISPLAIAAGYVPLWRWYPRDAYPIGLVFCPAMFFLLRYLYERFGLR
jgi:hypothetical protein